MPRLSASVCIDAPTAVVWDRLARLEDIQLWSEVIRRATCDGRLSRGVGAERTCELKGNLVIQERWVDWDEGRSFKYEGSGLPFLKHAINVWSVHPEGASQSLLKTEAEVELKGGLFGRLLEPAMALAFRRMGSTRSPRSSIWSRTDDPYTGNCLALRPPASQCRTID
jgi:hypothetical protein